MERIGHLVGLQHGEVQQFVGGGGREGGVLLGRERAEAVPGLRGDDDAGAAARDDVAELLEHQGGAVQVDGEDRLGRGLDGETPRRG